MSITNSSSSTLDTPPFTHIALVCCCKQRRDMTPMPMLYADPSSCHAFPEHLLQTSLTSHFNACSNNIPATITACHHCLSHSPCKRPPLQYTLCTGRTSQNQTTRLAFDTVSILNPNIEPSSLGSILINPSLSSLLHGTAACGLPRRKTKD